jgi:hypothetical protein
VFLETPTGSNQPDLRQACMVQNPCLRGGWKRKHWSTGVWNLEIICRGHPLLGWCRAACSTNGPA